MKDWNLDAIMPMAKKKYTNNDLCTLHRKLKIEQHDLHYKPVVNSSAHESGHRIKAG
jgi:hypothetical protein